MQVQSVNNNYNTNFKALKGIKCEGYFKPKENLEHAIAVKKVIESPEFKLFGEKYDFIASFNNYLGRLSHYSLFLEPVTEAENENNTTASENHLPNLPTSFCVCGSSEYSDRDALGGFINYIEKTSFSDLTDRLEKTINEKNEESAKTQKAADITKQIEDSGIPFID